MEHTINHFRSVLLKDFHTLAERFAVASLGLFGSRVRGDARPESDLDILVSYSRAPSLLKFIELENYLSDLLGVKVDLVLRDCLRESISQHILDELTPV